MDILALGASLFFLGFVVHLIIWRSRRFMRTAQMLISIFVTSIMLGTLLLLVVSQEHASLRDALPATPAGWAQAVVLGLAIAAAYVMTYPAVEVDSPTFVVVEAVAAAGEKGLSRDELFAQLGDELFVGPRIDDLLTESLVIDDRGRYVLTTKGRHLASYFMTWQAILRTDKGG